MLNYLNRRRKKGQSTLEYAILIIIIIAVLLVMQMYIRRGVQGRLKSATDDIGDQFSPGNTNVVKRRTTNTIATDTFTAGQQQTNINSENSREFMSSNIINVNQEFWGN